MSYAGVMDYKPTNESLATYRKLLRHLPADVTLTPAQVDNDLRKILASDNEHSFYWKKDASQAMSSEYGAAFRVKAEAEYLLAKRDLDESA